MAHTGYEVEMELILHTNFQLIQLVAKRTRMKGLCSGRKKATGKGFKLHEGSVLIRRGSSFDEGIRTMGLNLFQRNGHELEMKEIRG